MLFQEPGLEFGVTVEDAGERVRVEGVRESLPGGQPETAGTGGS